MVARGEVFALLGPNGAGKTTTIEILEGFPGRDAGEVAVLGWTQPTATRSAPCAAAWVSGSRSLPLSPSFRCARWLPATPASIRRLDR